MFRHRMLQLGSGPQVAMAELLTLSDLRNRAFEAMATATPADAIEWVLADVLRPLA